MRLAPVIWFLLWLFCSVPCTASEGEASRPSDCAFTGTGWHNWEAVLVLPVRMELDSSNIEYSDDVLSEWFAFQVKRVRPWNVYGLYHLEKAASELGIEAVSDMDSETVLSVARALQVDGILVMEITSNYESIWNYHHIARLTIEDVEATTIGTCRAKQTMWNWSRMGDYKFDAVERATEELSSAIQQHVSRGADK